MPQNWENSKWNYIFIFISLLHYCFIGTNPHKQIFWVFFFIRSRSEGLGIHTLLGCRLAAYPSTQRHFPTSAVQTSSSQPLFPHLQSMTHSIIARINILIYLCSNWINGSLSYCGITEWAIHFTTAQRS